MSQFSPYTPRVGVLAVSVSEPPWAQPLRERWSPDDVRIGHTEEAVLPDGRCPDLLLMVGERATDAAQWQAAGRIAARASAQRALVVGLFSGVAHSQDDAYEHQALHGVIEVVATTPLDTALDALLRLVLRPGIIRLEMEELAAFFQPTPHARLSMGCSNAGQTGIEAAMADAIQLSHQAALAAPTGRWLVGIMSDASLGAAEFNAAGEWLQSRVADSHEITVMASCDQHEGAATGVVVLAGR